MTLPPATTVASIAAIVPGLTGLAARVEATSVELGRLSASCCFTPLDELAPVVERTRVSVVFPEPLEVPSRIDE